MLQTRSKRVQSVFNALVASFERVSDVRLACKEFCYFFNTSGARFTYTLMRVGYAWCTSGARRCTSLKVSARFARVWAIKILNMLKNFLKARRVPGV